MAIAVRAVSTGASNNATSQATALPTGTTTGDVTILTAVQAYSINGAGLPTLTPPAGWTVLFNWAGHLVCWRKWVSGDTATPTCTSNKSDYWMSGAITYSGLDSTAPIDVYASSLTYKSTAVLRAPPVVPNFAGDQLLAIFQCPTNGTPATITLPSGYTARVASAVGPGLRMCDKLLASGGTQTGYADATGGVSSGDFPQMGMTVALHASGAAAATPDPPLPVIVGSADFFTPGLITLPLNLMNVRDGDLLVYLTTALDVVAPTTGWTQVACGMGSQVLIKRWSTGDSLAPTMYQGAAAYAASDLLILRRSGTGTGLVWIDTFASATANGATAAPSLSPTQANELLIVHHGGRDGTARTWSAATTGLTKIETTQNGGPNSRTAFLSPAPMPTTGGFFLTLSGTAPNDAWAGVFAVGLPASIPLPCATVLRGTASGLGTGGTSKTITLPTGRVAGDLTLVAVMQPPDQRTLTIPAGWTRLIDTGWGFAVLYRIFVGGDPTTLTVTSSVSSSYWAITAVAYSGVDTTTPIDTYGYCGNTGYSSPIKVGRAPSLNPNFNAEKLVCIYSDTYNGSRGLMPPIGSVSLVQGPSGTGLTMVDRVLLDGAPTGNLDATEFVAGSPTLEPVIGVQIALKPSSAVAATPVADPYPVWAGMNFTEVSGTTSYGVELATVGLQTGDLVMILADTTSAVTLSGGLIGGGDAVFTQITSPTPLASQVFTRVWNTVTDDGASLTLNWPSSTQKVNYAACAFRKSGTGSALPVVDNSATTTSTGTAGTSSLTPAGTNELLLTWFGTRTAAAGTFSAVTAGLTIERSIVAGPVTMLGWQYPSPNPSGSYSVTLTSRAIDAFAALIKLASAAAPVTSSPGAGLIAFTGYAPTATGDQVDTPGAGLIAFTGYAPAVVGDRIDTPDAGLIAFTGYGPDSLVSLVAAPDAGLIELIGFAPTTINVAKGGLFFHPVF